MVEDIIFDGSFIDNLLASLSVKKMLKIGQHSAKIWTKVQCLVFLTHSVQLFDLLLSLLLGFY